MLKSQALKALQDSIKESGDGHLGENEIFRIVFGDKRADEHLARHRVIMQMIQAKRDVLSLGFNMKMEFFSDIWPAAKQALLRSASCPKELP